MESLRARLSRRAQQRRMEEAETGAVDAESVKGFWLSLAVEARIEALRFEEKTLVQRLHGYMNALCHTDLFCKRNGQGDSPDRLRGFGFERPAERTCYGRTQGPTAFRATEEFAESANIFAELESHLGSSFLEGRPALQRQDWAVVTEASPDSWHSLQTQALRLVELAIFQSYQEAVACGAFTPAVDQEGAATAGVSSQAAPHSVAALSASSKRRARRKKKGVGVTQARAEEDWDDQDAEAVGKPAMMAAGTLSLPSGLLDRAPGGTSEAQQADALQMHRDAGGAQEEIQEQQPDAVRTPMWSAWLPRFLVDGSSEWNWMIFQQSHGSGGGSGQPLLAQPAASGIRAFVKHTFLDVEAQPDENREKRRPKSARF